MRKEFDSLLAAIYMEYLILESSYAKRSFKKRIGSANLFLITILVGLDAIESGEIIKSPTFSTSWNPRNMKNSAQRSSRFALNAALSWVIDNLDMYFILTHRKPSIIESVEISNKLSGAGQSVSQKMDTFVSVLLKTDLHDIDKFASLVALGIQWRNNTTHFDADNIISKKYKDVLTASDNKQWFHDNFQGLDIKETLRHFEEGTSPSFKEITSIIRAVHIFVDQLDSFLISGVDVNRVAVETIQKHYSDSQKRKGYVLNYESERKTSMVKMILLSYGFSETPKRYGNNVLELEPNKIDGMLRVAIGKK